MPTQQWSLTVRFYILYDLTKRTVMFSGDGWCSSGGCYSLGLADWYSSNISFLIISLISLIHLSLCLTGNPTVLSNMYELNLFQEGSSKVPAKFQEGFSKVPAKFQQGSRTVPVFRGVHFRGTTPRPQRLKPNTIAVGKYNRHETFCDA